MYNLPELHQKASLIRQDIVTMLVESGSGHAAGALGMADIFSALYFYLLKHRPHQPAWENRDRLVLSCGHICPVLYASLAESGYFPKSELSTLRRPNSRLQGHPLLGSLPGIEVTSGSLGQGVSVAVGMALAAKLDRKPIRVVCVTSDGEQQEGQVWEAYMLAAKYRLDNLTFILDYNGIQIDGYTHEVMPLEPLKAKLTAFGLSVLEIDGHNMEAIADAYLKAKTIHSQPSIILAHTIPGKDVEFMENLPAWHGKSLTLQEGINALHELRSLNGNIAYE